MIISYYIYICIISYHILISYIYTTTIRNMYHFSFLLHLFYYTFSLSGFSSLFLSVLLVSLYTIISTISQSLFPGSCFSSLILCSFAKAFSIIFLSIKLDCSIFYSIHYLRLYTLTIYIYILYLLGSPVSFISFTFNFFIEI